MKKGHLAGIGFALLFGLTFLFSKVALKYVTPMGLIAYRFTLAFLVFEGLRATKLIKIRFKGIPVSNWLLVGLFQPVLYFIFETYGLSYSTSAEAGMMIALIPIFVSLLSAAFLKEKPKPIQFLTIALSVSGVLFIQIMNRQSTSQSWLGFALLGLAVISAAAYNLASRKASKNLKPMETTYYMMAMGMIVFNAIYLVQLGSSHQLSTYITVFSNPEWLFPIAYLGIIASVGGFFLLNYALSQLPAHVSSVYSNLSTVIAVIAGAIFLKETMAWYHIVGGLMIITGVYGTVYFQTRSSIHKMKTRRE